MKVISAERIAFLAEDFRRGFIDHCGFSAGRIEYGLFESRIVIEERHRQQDGFIHAGVMATMADHTAGYAAFTTVDPGFQILTVEFKINFLKPAFGRTLRCTGRVLRGGSRIIVAESDVFDLREPEAEPEPVARAMVTLMAVRREKLAPPSRRAARGVPKKRPGLRKGP